MAKKESADNQRTTGARKPRKKLTPKQEAFAEHYLANGGNGVRAAKAAGYQGDYGTLNEVARENLQKPAIASRVRARIEGLAANTDEVLCLLADHLRADLGEFRDCFDASGRFDLEKAKEKGISHLIKKLDVKATPVRDAGGQIGISHTTRIELHDSQEAAGKLLGVLGLKQAKAENEQDVKRRREWAEEKVSMVMEQFNLDEDGAREWLKEHAPAAAKWLM